MSFGINHCCLALKHCTYLMFIVHNTASISNCLAYIPQSHCIVNARHVCARTRVIVLILCVCACVCVRACSEFAALISGLYTKYDTPVYFSRF